MTAIREHNIEELYALIEQWTRAEIMARFGLLGGLGDIDYAHIQIEKKDKIRALLYGTDNLVLLGEKWGILKDERIRAKKAAKEALEQRAQKLRAALADMDEDE